MISFFCYRRSNGRELVSNPSSSNSSVSSSTYDPLSSDELWEWRSGVSVGDKTASEDNVDESFRSKGLAGKTSPFQSVGNFGKSVRFSSNKLRESPSFLRSPSLSDPGTSSSEEVCTLKVTKLGNLNFFNQYLVIRFLGKGTSGQVFLCLDVQTRKLYAIKIIKKRGKRATLSTKNSHHSQGGKASSLHENIKREISLMKSLGSHRNIATLREIINDPLSSRVLIVMEYFEGGSILTRRDIMQKQRLPEALARFYIRDMARGLCYLHANKIVHGDLKPENTLMGAAGRIALSDFGSSKIVDADESVTQKGGTPAFLAPEIMASTGKYRGRPADVYALGVCLYLFLFGKLPFEADSIPELASMVTNNELELPDDVVISSEAKGLLLQMLNKNPDERIDLSQIAKHVWITDHGRLKSLSSKNTKQSEEMEIGDIELTEMVVPEYEMRQFERGEYILGQNDPTEPYIIFIVEGTCDVLYHTSPESPMVFETQKAIETLMSTSSSSYSSSSLLSSPWSKSLSFKHENVSLRSQTGNDVEAHGKNISPFDSSFKEAGITPGTNSKSNMALDSSRSLPVPNNGNSGSLRFQRNDRVPEYIRQGIDDAAKSIHKLCRRDGQYKVGEREAGDFVGEEAFCTPNNTGERSKVYLSSLVASSPVVYIACIPVDGASAYFMAHPLAKQRLYEVFWSRQNDIYTIDALINISSKQ